MKRAEPLCQPDSLQQQANGKRHPDRGTGATAAHERAFNPDLYATNPPLHLWETKANWRNTAFSFVRGVWCPGSVCLDVLEQEQHTSNDISFVVVFASTFRPK